MSKHYSITFPIFDDKEKKKNAPIMFCRNVIVKLLLSLLFILPVGRPVQPLLASPYL